jgi:hypothetical protein
MIVSNSIDLSTKIGFSEKCKTFLIEAKGV